MTVVIINPGSGSVRGGTGSILRRNADQNMRALCRDCGIPSSCIKRYRSKVNEDGRYSYDLLYKGRRCEIEMPGLKLRKVRIEPEDSAWDFPRLYVDGSSWLWPFAVSSVCERLRLKMPAVYADEYERHQDITIRKP